MARWVTPGGGVDPGESHSEAGVRELEEETGLALTTPGEPVVWENDFDVEWDALTTTLDMRFSIELRQMHSNRLMHNGPMTRALPSYAISDLEHFAAVDCQNMTNDDAVEFGILAVHVIKKWNLNLAVEIILGTDVVFKAKLKSTNADNDPWLTGKSSSSETIERTIALGDASPP